MNWRARTVALIACFAAFAGGLAATGPVIIPWWVHIGLCAWNLLVLGVVDGKPSKAIEDGKP